MTAERIAWEFASAPVREQLRIRSIKTPAGQRVKVYPFEREILDKRPRPDEAVEAIVQALEDLGTCRPVGMAIGRIPITAIWTYWERRGYRAHVVEVMTHATLRADAIYLAEHSKRRTA